MTFNVHKLREKIARTEDVLYTRYVTDRHDEQRKWDERFESWRDESAPKLHARLAAALKKLDEIGVLTADDVPNSWHSNSLFWASRDTRPTDPKAREDWTVPNWLVEFRSFVDVISDDEISAHALEKAGLLKYVRQLA